MRKTSLAIFGLVPCILLQPAKTQSAPQDDSTHLRMNVVLVQLSIAVTDGKGNYVNGLRPEDFEVTEDKIPQKISSFEEGSGTTNDAGSQGDDQPQISRTAVPADSQDAESHMQIASTALPEPHGNQASVFVLFDTSNYMYRGFVFAQDAITDFIRSMDNASRVAFYSYCRDLSRAMKLTSDHFSIVNAVRSTVAGDDAALYNSLLLTVKDAAPLKGRKAIVVFSNGPDNASSVPPEDVAELAQSTGTIIYIISTRQAEEDPASAAAFERMSKVSGGKAYFAKNWLDEKKAFASIRNDLVHLYTVSYYPQANPNRGWRSIKVRLVGKNLQKYHLRTRDGYRLVAQR
jgi:Ca-activated chloride channel family protein